METYLAIINVKAEFEEKDGQLGYHVIYPDNHEGWIPLDLFEKQAFRLREPDRITSDDVNRFIKNVRSEQIDERTTLTKLTTVTDVIDYKTSTCVNPENYSTSIGEHQNFTRLQDGIFEFLGKALKWGLNGILK
jgi:hypothetical protein